MQNIQRFIDEWTEDELGLKPVFASFFEDLAQRAGTVLDFHERPGITFSLRGSHPNQKERPLFVMIDVIDDDPKQRWLSVCFYGDTIADPDEKGDFIPGGLLGADGHCFDLDEADDSLSAYILNRIQEAYESACSGN